MPRKKSDTVQLKVRMKEPLRARLEKAAKARGVSLNTEAVERMERSFQREETKFEEFGGKAKFNLCRLFAVTAEALEPRFRQMLKEAAKRGQLPDYYTADLDRLTWDNDLMLFRGALGWWLNTVEPEYFGRAHEFDEFEAGLSFGPGKSPPGSIAGLKEFGRLLQRLVENEDEEDRRGT